VPLADAEDGLGCALGYAESNAALPARPRGQEADAGGDAHADLLGGLLPLRMVRLSVGSNGTKCASWYPGRVGWSSGCRRTAGHVSAQPLKATLILQQMTLRCA